jgi:hypothetical protein
LRQVLPQSYRAISPGQERAILIGLSSEETDHERKPGDGVSESRLWSAACSGGWRVERLTLLVHLIGRTLRGRPPTVERNAMVIVAAAIVSALLYACYPADAQAADRSGTWTASPQAPRGIIPTSFSNAPFVKSACERRRASYLVWLGYKLLVASAESGIAVDDRRGVWRLCRTDERGFR